MLLAVNFALSNTNGIESEVLTAGLIPTVFIHLDVFENEIVFVFRLVSLSLAPVSVNELDQLFYRQFVGNHFQRKTKI